MDASEARVALMQRAKGHGRGAIAIFVVAPLFDSPEEAVDWFEARGIDRPSLWGGPDGSVRATAVMEGT